MLQNACLKRRNFSKIMIDNDLLFRYNILACILVRIPCCPEYLESGSEPKIKRGGELNANI
jgi:hypothetical protein